MAPLIAASPIRVAIIDDDSGLVTVLDRRFSALRWEREVLGYAADSGSAGGAASPRGDHQPRDHRARLSGAAGDALPGLALLVCTGTAPVADRVRGLRGGADDWVTKPCHPEELVARIQAVLRRRRVGAMPVDDAPLAAGELEIRPDTFDAYVRRSARLAVAQGVRAAAAAGQRRRAGAASARTSTSGCGATRWLAAIARWTCSCASCARSSSAVARSGATCTRTSGWATGSPRSGRRITGCARSGPARPAPVVERAPREPVTEQRADPPRTPAGHPAYA